MMATTTVLININGIEIDAEATYTYSPGIPAELNGEPEDCREEEPAEIEVSELLYLEVDYSVILFIDDVRDDIEMQILDKIEAEKMGIRSIAFYKDNVLVEGSEPPNLSLIFNKPVEVNDCTLKYIDSIDSDQIVSSED